MIYLGYVWPFESNFITKMEIFNEIAAIMLCYIMLCFTDWIPRASTRYQTGWVFIGLICTHLSIHLGILILNSYFNAKQKAKQKIYRFKQA